MKLWKLATVATAVAILAGAAPAFADGGGAPAGTGWDGNPDTFTLGGSDSLYPVAQVINGQFNAMPGCITDINPEDPNLAQCLNPPDARNVNNGNYDHDAAFDAFPAGSTAGVQALVASSDAGGQCLIKDSVTGVYFAGHSYSPPIDVARSSSGATACNTGTAGTTTGAGRGDNVTHYQLTYWQFARDGVGLISFGSRSGINFTSADLVKIYKCQVTDWSDATLSFNQPSVTQAAGTIKLYGMNPSSGTYASLRDALRAAIPDSTFDIDSQACVQKLADGTYPFENDVKPLIKENTAADASNILWWSSWGELTTYPFKRNGTSSDSLAVPGSFNKYNGVAPTTFTIGTGNSYGLKRYFSFVTKKTDADLAQASDSTHFGSVSGGTSGKTGAIRQWISTVCSPQFQLGGTTNALATNPYNGLDYYTQFSADLSNFSLAVTTTADRVGGFGRCKVINT